MPTFDFTGGVLPAGATLTRAAGPWSRVAASKLIVLGTSADTPRFDYDPITGDLRGLLVEPQRTNFQTRSAPLTATDYRIYGSLSVSTGLAPDGTNGVRTITGNGAAMQGFDQFPSDYGSNGGQSQSFSMYARAGSTALLRLFYQSGDKFANFNLSSRSVTAAASGVDARIVQAPQSMARVSATLIKSNENDYYYGFIDNANATTNSIEFWGVQLENGSQPTSYIPTTTAAATRPAETLTLNWGAIGVGDGSPTVTYTFDDNSTQKVATTISGGLSTVPTNLNRSTIRSASIPDGIITPIARTGILYDRAPRRGILYG